jgi:hypothetical protein
MNYDIAVVNNTAEITSRIDEIVLRVQKRIEDLNLKTIDATEDNKKILRDTRAELNKEVKQYEEDLKQIELMINSGFNELKKQYKEKIKSLYKLTDDELKEKIDEITQEQLKENQDYSKEYYEAKLKSMPLRIGVEYDDVPWDFTFNSSKKSIRDTANNHFEAVEEALKIIDNHKYKNELEAFWKYNKFNLGKALIELENQLAIANKYIKAQEEELKKREEKIEAKEIEIKEEIKEEIKISNLKVEELISYVFELEMTDSQLYRLVNFLENENIEFNLLK